MNRHVGGRLRLQDPHVYASVRERLALLTPSSRPAWGKMSVAQMLAHCAEVQEVLNGKPLVGTPWFIRLTGPLLKRAVLARRPYPRGVRTHPQYVVSDERDFAAERQRLEAALAEYAGRPDQQQYVDHPIFGRLTPGEGGWAAYKHLDHHLVQFGA